MLAKA